MASCVANFVKNFNLKICQSARNNLSCVSLEVIQVRNYAARKGTRERRLKLLKAQKAKKQDKDKKKKRRVVEHFSSCRNLEHMKPECTDDVFPTKCFRWKIYPFAEAIQCHRETHHPSVYNLPDAFVNARIELDMTAAKKNRFVDNFTRLVAMPHIFPSGDEQSVMVFCKTEELQRAAKEAGANIVGDSGLIREIEKGTITVRDFDYVLAHPDVIPELVPVRNLMKKVYPNVRSGTLGVDIANMVQKFRNGIKYSATKDEREQDFGLIQVIFGKLDMEVDHLQKNLEAVLQDVYSLRPKRPGPFITRVLVGSPPSQERLKVDLAALLPQQEEQEEYDSDEEDESDTRKTGKV